MKQLLRATLLHADDALLQHLVSDEMIEEIKAAGDPNPTIKVYSIGHEGTATPMKVTPQGKKRVFIRYLKEAVKKIAGALPTYAPVFHRHAASNSTTGREVVGRVVGKTVKKIKGVLHTLAAIHVFAPHRDKNLDVASIEADCTYGKGEDGAVQMREVHSVSGIALGDSETDTPAFPLATLRGAFQCMAEEYEAAEVHHNRGDEEMSKEELLRKIREEGLTPLDCFSEDTLRGLQLVKDAISAAVEEPTKQLGEAQETISRYQTELKEANAEKDAALTAATDLKKTALQSRAETLLASLAEERKLKAPAIAFAKSGLKNFQSDATDEDALKKELDAYLEGKIKERDEWLEAEGIKSAPGDGDDQTNDGPPPKKGDQTGPPEGLSPDNEFAIDYKAEIAKARTGTVGAGAQ